MSGFSVRPLVPGRPHMILSGLAEINSGRFNLNASRSGRKATTNTMPV